MKKLRIGLLGLGTHAKKIWLPTLINNTHCELSACGSQFITSHKDLPNNIKKYSSYQEVIKDPEIDAVLISTKNSLHSELTISALKNNKHVLCEKPLCFEINQLDQIKIAHSIHKKILCTGFMYSLHPQWQFVREIIKNDPRTQLKMTGTFQYNTSNKKNVRSEAGEGGIIADALCYFLDVYRVLSLDEPQTSYCRVIKNSLNSPSCAHVILTSQKGHYASIDVSMTHSSFQRLTISTEDVLIDLESPFIIPKGKHSSVHLSYNAKSKKQNQFPAFNCYDSLLIKFIESVYSNVLHSDLTDGCKNAEQLCHVFSDFVC